MSRDDPYRLQCMGDVWEIATIFARNVHFTLSKMTIANQTQLTSLCFGYDRAALSAPSLVGPIRYNLRIVTDIAIVGPRTLATAGA